METDLGTKPPRIPAPVNGIQINFCKNPLCLNYGRPASSEPQPRGRKATSRIKDSYKLSGGSISAGSFKATSELPSYQTSFTNGQNVSVADAASDEEGSRAGFRPDELLEAALASSLNMTIRMYAEEHSIPLTSVSTTVKLDQNYPEEAIFNYAFELAGSLSESDRRLLTEAALSCPVRQTLSKKLSFQE